MDCREIRLTEGSKVQMRTYFIDCYLQTDYREGHWHQEPRPVFLILPGGSYYFHSEREAEPVALAFTALGWHCAVLYYSVGEDSRMPQPLEDVSLAIWYLRSHAGEYHIDPDRIIVGGFSAGGNLAAIVGTQWNTSGLCERLGIPYRGNRPDALMLAYAPTSLQGLAPVSEDLLATEPTGSAFTDPTPEVDAAARVSQDTPPVFIWTTGQDQLVDPAHSLTFAEACLRQKVPFELHFFQFGQHGLALANEVTDFGLPEQPNVSLWVPMFARWASSVLSDALAERRS